MPDNREKLQQTPLHSKIFAGKKKTYLDHELKLKEHVPPKFYDVGLTMIQTGKSNLDKAKRYTQAAEVINWQTKQNFPAPGKHSINYGSVEKRDLAFIGQKAHRWTFLHEAEAFGQQSPHSYKKKYEGTDPKLRSPKYSAKIKADYDVACFLKSTLASKNVSPHHYEPMKSFYATQHTSVKWNMRPRGRSSIIDMAIKNANKTPGPGFYDLK